MASGDSARSTEYALPIAGYTGVAMIWFLSNTLRAGLEIYTIYSMSSVVRENVTNVDVDHFDFLGYVNVCYGPVSFGFDTKRHSKPATPLPRL